LERKGEEREEEREEKEQGGGLTPPMKISAYGTPLRK